MHCAEAGYTTTSSGRAAIPLSLIDEAEVCNPPVVWSYRKISRFPGRSRRWWADVVLAVIVVGASMIRLGGPPLVNGDGS